MSLIQNITGRVPVKLTTPAGADATGIVVANIKNARCQIIKSDGTTANITLVLNTNFFEIDSTNSPGLYHVIVPNTATNLLGALQYTLYPNAIEFLSFVGTTSVGIDPSSLATSAQVTTSTTTTATNITNAVTTTATNISTSTSTTATNITSAVTSIKGPQSLSISTLGGGASFDPNADNLHAIKQAIGNIAMMGGSPWDELRAAHITNGTFGEAIRILYQVARGHIKIDKVGNQLIVYQEDGTTPLFSCPLLRNGVPASVYAEERLSG